MGTFLSRASPLETCTKHYQPPRRLRTHSVKEFPDSTRRRAKILARCRTPLRLLPDSVQLRHEYAFDADDTRHHAVILAVRRTPLRLSSASGQLWRSHGCIMYWYMDKYAQYGTTLFSLFKISCI